MKWSRDLPRVKGMYFCWHRRWGRVVMGYDNGWGSEIPEKWLDGDDCLSCEPDRDGGAEVLTQ